MEHYVDGDLVNASEPTHISQAGPGSLHVWGKYLSGPVYTFRGQR